MRVSVPMTTIYEQTGAFREGHGTMVGAWHCRCLSCGFESRLVQDAHVPLLSILGHCFEVVSLGKAHHPQMLHLTQVKMSTW